MDYPPWFIDVENNEPGNGDVELAEMLFNLKGNVKQRRRVDKGDFAYISIKNSHPNVFHHVEANIISFPTTLTVEPGSSAVEDVRSKKKNLNRREAIRLRPNDSKIDFDILCYSCLWK